MSAVSIIGIIGAIQQSNATTAKAFSDAKDLRLASAVLFCVIVVLVTLVVVITAVRRVRRQGFLQSTVWPLLLFVACASIETVYRVWSSVVYSGFITAEAAVGVLIFMPEAIFCLTWLLIDMDNINSVRWMFAKKSHAEEAQESKVECT